MMISTDRSLVARCRAGKESAWEQLLDSHYDGIGRFVFLAAPVLTESEVPEICRRTFIRAVGEINQVSDAPSCRVWLLRVASDEVRRIGRERLESPGEGLCDQCSGVAASGLSEGRGVDSDALMRQLRRQFDRFGGPCVELAELWFFSELPEAEVAAALEVNPDLLLRRLRMCLQRMQTLEPLREADGQEPVDMPYPPDFARRDVGHPLGTRLAAYAKGRGALITHPFPVPQAVREEILAAVRSEFRKPCPLLPRSVMSLLAPHWRVTATVAGGALVVVMALLHGEGGSAPAGKGHAGVSNCYWSTKSELPRVLLPDSEPDLACPTGSNGELQWSIAPAHKATQEAAPPDAADRIQAEDPIESLVMGSDQPDPVVDAVPETEDLTDAARVKVVQAEVGDSPLQVSDVAQARQDLTAASEPRTVRPQSVLALASSALPADPPPPDVGTPPPPPPVLLAVVDRPTPATRTPAPTDIEAGLPPASEVTTRPRQFVRANKASQFRRNFNSPPMPTVLESFDVDLTQSGVMIIDADGSEYRGTVDWAADQNTEDATSQARGLAFEARGVHRTTGESVVFTGWLIPQRAGSIILSPMASSPSEAAATSRMPLLVEGVLAIEGSVQYGARTRLQVHAGAARHVTPEEVA
ncbi:MAG TPA: hypothetical protein PK640_10460, partial [Verrucomicrobiota bacterium]|nr:hypothetical protein [Verrucomicrobiota bacterium]